LKPQLLAKAAEHHQDKSTTRQCTSKLHEWLFHRKSP
jgi:hypothetical protein